MCVNRGRRRFYASIFISTPIRNRLHFIFFPTHEGLLYSIFSTLHLRLPPPQHTSRLLPYIFFFFSLYVFALLFHIFLLASRLPLCVFFRSSSPPLYTWSTGVVAIVIVASLHLKTTTITSMLVKGREAIVVAPPLPL